MKRALIGAGGFAYEIKAHIGDETMKCFVDDIFWKENNEFIFPLSQFNPNEYEVIVAIGNPRDRYDMVQRLPKETKYFTYIHPTAHIMSDNIKIGAGTFIGAYCILTTNINIGEHGLLKIDYVL
jgi:acetyltransferase-like isoleucine patch superfamily enzyme